MKVTCHNGCERGPRTRMFATESGLAMNCGGYLSPHRRPSGFASNIVFPISSQDLQHHWRLHMHAMAAHQSDAVCRTLAGLASRLWAAAEILRQPMLCQNICQPASESARPCCEWRFHCLQVITLQPCQICISAAVHSPVDLTATG